MPKEETALIAARIPRSLVERITIRRMRPGRTNLLPIAETAQEIGIGLSSLRSILKYGESAVGDTIRPKLEKWLKHKGE